MRLLRLPPTRRSILRARCIATFAFAWVLASASVQNVIAGSSDGVWAGIGPPAVRHSATMIFDPARDEVVLFGGSPRRNDLWSLTVGANPTWTHRSGSGARPSERVGHAAIHDPVRNRMIVFGGDDGSGIDYESDVTVLPLDGSAIWSGVSPTGTPPPGRADHTLVYDSIRDRLIVFGGLADTVKFADVWALSLAGTPSWTQILPSGPGPSARSGHVAIFDPVGDRMIVFGGSDVGACNDAWALSLSGTPTWNQIAQPGEIPPPTTEATAVYDPTPGRLVVYGGFDGGAVLSDDIWVLSLDSLRWTRLEPVGDQPPARYRHSATYDVTRDRMILFGGSDPNRENDVWALDLSGAAAWTQLPDLGTPWDRGSQAAIYDPLTQRMVLFGGAEGSAVRNNTRVLRLTGTQRWSTLSFADSVPGGRVRYSALHDPVRSRMIIFGGWDFNTFLNDTWAMTLSGTPTWSRIDPPGPRPSPRMEHAAIYDSRRDRMIVIGGYEGHRDVWELPLGGTPAWSQIYPTGPFPYYRGVAAIYDPVGDRAIVFTGVPHLYESELEVWELTLGDVPQWNRLITTGVSHRGHWGVTAIYDPVRHRVVLMDGDVDWLPPAITELSLATLTWRAFDSATAVPRRRTGHSAVYDSHRDRMLITGYGLGEPYSESNSWSLTWGDPVKPQVSCATSLGEQQGTLTLPYLVSHSLSGTRAVAWTLQGDRAWPGFPMRGIVNVEGGAPETLNVSVPVPDTAAAGRVGLHIDVELSGATGNVNSCDHEVTIAVTPTLAAVVSAEAADGRVRLRWHVSGEGFVTVQRRTLEAPWADVGRFEPDGEGYVVMEDADVETGASYGYRLAWTTDGHDIFAGEIWVEVPSHLGLSLAGMTPNPSQGPLAVAFSLPTSGTATVEVLDVAGRATGLRQRKDLPGGNHVVALGAGRPLAPGIYLVRLEFNGQVLHRRAVVLR